MSYVEETKQSEIYENATNNLRDQIRHYHDLHQTHSPLSPADDNHHNNHINNSNEGSENEHEGIHYLRQALDTEDELSLEINRLFHS